MRRIDRIIIHHSASPWATTTGAKIRAWHKTAKPVGRGFNDVAYHYMVTCRGVDLGRPDAVPGAHDAGENATSIGVCLAGDWRPHKDGDPWRTQPHAWKQLTIVCADLCLRYSLSPDVIRGHGEDEPASTPTECPGFAVERLRAAVAEELGRRVPDHYTAYQESLR